MIEEELLEKNRFTKEEYEKALKEINDAFYGANFLNNQMRRFDGNLNLLRELVNEHFKENVETNFEHYKDGIIELCIDELAISKGKVVECCTIPCSECDFKDKDCQCISNHEIMKWFDQPYKKPKYKLTQCEYDMLDTIFGKEARFSTVYLIGELKKKGYFENIKCDSNVRVKDILANCEVTK